MTFLYEYIVEQEDVRKHIQECESVHTQQVAYSTFHDALTQICYGCLKIRTSLYIPEPKPKVSKEHQHGE